MRKFSPLEKEILEKLINSKALNEQGLLLCSKFLKDNYVGEQFELSLMVNSKEREVFITIPFKKYNYEKFLREKIIFVITFFNLIDELKSERKIYLVGDRIDDVILGLQFDKKISLAEDINNIICDSFFKLIAITEELRELVMNNFKSLEEIHHLQNIEIANQSLKEAQKSVALAEESLKESKKSVKKANYTIFTSVILALIGLFSSFYIANKQTENEIKIDRNQYESVINKADTLSKLLKNIVPLSSFFPIPKD